MTEENFIDLYTERVMEYTDAPKVFIEGSAYYLVSATLGEFYRNKLVPFGSQRPNLWVMLSSIPGRMRRSTVLGLSYRCLKEVMGKGVEDVIIEEGTPEGIMDAIGEDPQSTYTIQSTEFGSCLQRMSGKHYQTGVSTLLSKLYYGEGDKQYLSQRGGKNRERILPGGLYVTALVGLQEAQYYITLPMLYQGLVRRLLILYVEQNERWQAPIDDTRTLFKLTDLVKELKTKRKSLEHPRRKEVNPIIPDSVSGKINSFAQTMDHQLDEKRDNVSLYKQSLWEHLLKLTTLRAVARGNYRLSDAQQEFYALPVYEKDFEKAKQFLDEVEDGMKTIIDRLGEQEYPIRTEKTGEDRTYRYIREAGPDGIAFDELGQKFPGVYRVRVHRWVRNLEASGKIVEEVVKTGKAGRPPTVFKLKEYAEEQ